VPLPPLAAVLGLKKLDSSEKRRSERYWPRAAEMAAPDWAERAVGVPWPMTAPRFCCQRVAAIMALAGPELSGPRVAGRPTGLPPVLAREKVRG